MVDNGNNFKPMADNRLRLYEVAKQNLGKDLVPLEDALACAGTVNAVHRKAFGKEIGGGLSTYQMYQVLRVDPRFQKTMSPLPGDVCISPTGMGDSKKIRNGHVGIVMEGEKIASNNSLTGLFEINYTFASWKKRWKDTGKYPMDFFRIVTPPSYEVYKPAPVIPKPTAEVPEWLKLFLDRNKTFGALRNPGWTALSKLCISEHPFCAFHGGKGTIMNPLQAHHIVPVHIDSKLEMERKNIIVLCWFCHFWHAHLGNFKLFNLNIRKQTEEMQEERKNGKI